MRERVMRAAPALALALLFGRPALAGDANGLLGVWKLVTATVEDIETAARLPLYGEHPTGYLILLPSGRMMALLTSADRKLPQTDEERSAAHRAMVAYSGTYTVEGDTWTTKPDIAWNPAFLVDQVRHFKLDGNLLDVETKPQMNPNFGKVVRVILVWQRDE